MRFRFACFGSQMLFSTEGGCKTCPMFNECLSESKAIIEAIKKDGDLDVDLFDRRIHQREVCAGVLTSTVVVKSRKREKLTELQRFALEDPMLNKKSKKIVAALYRKGQTPAYLRKAVMSGINPFSGMRPEALEQACAQLLNNELTASNLKSSLAKRGVSEKTASAQASNALKVLSHMRLIERRDGKYILMESYE